MHESKIFFFPLTCVTGPARDKMDLERNWPNSAFVLWLCSIKSIIGDLKALWKIPLFKYNLVMTVLIWICTVLLLKFLVFKTKKRKWKFQKAGAKGAKQFCILRTEFNSEEKLSFVSYTFMCEDCMN